MTSCLKLNDFMLRKVAERNVAPLLIRSLYILVGLLHVKLYTNHLHSEEISRFFYLTTLSYVVSSFIFVPAEQFLLAKFSNSKAFLGQWYSYVTHNAFYAALIVSSIFCVLGLFYGKIALIEIPLVILLPLIMYKVSVKRSYLNIRGHFLYVSILYFVEGLLKVILLTLFLYYFSSGTMALICSIIGALSVEYAIVAFGFNHRVQITNDLEKVSLKSLKSIISISGSALSNTVLSQNYKIIHELNGHGTTSANLGVCSNIGSSIMGAFSQLFSMMRYPAIYTNGIKGFRSFFAQALLLICFVITGVYIFLSDIVLLFTSSDFLEFKIAVLFGVAYEGVNLIVGGISIIFLKSSLQHVIFVIQLCCAILSVFWTILCVIWAPASPMILGMGLLITQMLMLFLILLYGKLRIL